MPPRKSDARKSDVSFAEPLEAATNAPANDTATEDSIKVGSTTTEKKDAVTIEVCKKKEKWQLLDSYCWLSLTGYRISTYQNPSSHVSPRELSPQTHKYKAMHC